MSRRSNRLVLLDSENYTLISLVVRCSTAEVIVDRIANDVILIIRISGWKE